MNILEKLGLGPKRAEAKLDSGHWKITVTPHGTNVGNHVVLTNGQYDRYKQWCAGGILIQDALPDLSKDDRETLMTGLNQLQWDKAFPPE